MAEQEKTKRTEYDRQRERVDSMTTAIRSEITWWVRLGRTHEGILEWREKHTNPNWAKMQMWAHVEVTNYFHWVMANYYEWLPYTHVLDGKRILSGAAALEGRYGEIGKQDEKKVDVSAHSYAYLMQDGRVLYVPWIEEARQEDIRKGRLTDTDLKAIYEAQPLRATSHLNGKPCLSKIVKFDPE